MEIEEGQAKVIEQFVNKASTLETTSSLANLIASHASLFAFSDILSLPNLLQLQGAEDSAYLDLLRLFAYGTWRDYKRNSCMLPKLSPDQFLKLKQLTVLTLSATNKVLSYNKLLEELDVSNVRELEDFLINECTYAGIVKGKLNQLGRCFEVYSITLDAICSREGSRAWLAWEYDRYIGNLPLLATFRLATSDSVLPLIEEKIDWASKMCQLDMDHQRELQGRIYEAKKDINFKSKQGHCFWENVDDCDYLNGPLEQEEDPIRSKRNVEWAREVA